MVLGAIPYMRKSNLGELDGWKMDSQYDLNVLYTSLVPLADELVIDKWMFSQDNGAFHSPIHTKSYSEAS